MHDTKETGPIIKCMERVSSIGLMEESTVATILPVRNMGLVSTVGQTEEITKVTFPWVNSTEKAYRLTPTKAKNTFFGKMGKKSKILRIMNNMSNFRTVTCV